MVRKSPPHHASPSVRLVERDHRRNTGRFLSGAIGIAAVVAMISSGGNSAVDPFRKADGFLFGISIIAFLAIVVLWPHRPKQSN